MNDLTQARKLIKDCQDTQNSYLDLGKCGITNLNELPELFECTHLETLILSNVWLDIENNCSTISCNIGKDNAIASIPEKISSLKNLTRLIICGSFEFPWELSDYSFLENLTGLQSLYLSSNKISDISFLENLTGLQSLDLSSNQISDYSFLENLTELQSLDLSSNKISDISFLENLTGLQSLELSFNKISDISFLKTLTGLQSLYLRSNKISDISFLETLTGLQSLDLRSNKISDYSFLKNMTGLQSLDLSFNQISDISFLENLTGLQSLDLSFNQISDISFLENLTGLQSLDLRSNKISDISFLETLTGLQSLDLSYNKISDISFLENLTGLQSLDLRFNKISDISFLENLTGLQSLYLSSNKISDYSFLENLTGLQSLVLSYNKISDISFLENLTGLQSLVLSYNKISDISFLENLTGLQSLDLRSNQISDISFLETLTGLQSLDLRYNQISDISFLENLTGLQSLDLSFNQISDYSFLENLTGLQSLDLSDNQISDISFLENLTGLQSLYLSFNQISDISFLENLTGLQSLYLSSNQISDISFLENLTGLQSLYLSSNQISDISFLENLTGLQSLDLRSNQISDISFLETLTGLQSLDLSDNQISDISFLENLTGLQSLDLSSNQISDYSFLENLTGLQSLYLSHNKISDYSFLENLTGLQSLYLSSNKISDISFLETLTGLQSLDLRSNKISDISFLETLTGLQSLDLRSNQISDISFLETLTGLQSLDLRSNQISDYSFLENLTGLQSLYLRSNQISDISFLENLTGLQSLYLSSNKISDYSFLETLTGLQSLYLSSNKISDYSFLENLTGLQSLDLSSNQISDYSFLENLTGLQSLDLSSNQISDISFLETLTGLQSLDLSSNNLKKIPLSIFRLNMEISMKEYGRGLCLYDNPIESPPVEILKQGKQSVLDWFEATKQKLNEIKVILIGEAKAGKTSLLKRLKSDEFDENEVQTDGVNIEDIAFGKCNTFEKQQSLHHITGHFWDFGGQEIMNATHQFFLTKRSVYVLILDARKDTNSATQVRDWVKRIKATGGDSPVIVLANQMDVNPGFGFENERDLQAEFPQIKCFIKVSCLTKDNIDLFKEKLAELIPTAELFQTEIDERWIQVKEKLQKETKAGYFLNESRFLEICNTSNLKEEREQKNAITFLHDLGLVLHFENLNLAEYYVLNPYWITYGVYQILTSAYAAQMKGEVSMDKLNFIVNEEKDKKAIYKPVEYKSIQYSGGERSFLIKILHQFKLCFCVGDTHFIIPDLLDTTEPSDITDPIRAAVSDNIQFVYEYEYLPKFIMPNIMVEAHHIITNRWRTGCVLHKDDCKALITNYRNRISIIVTGESKQKREFMAIVRNLIDSINPKNIKPARLIPLPGIEDSFADYEELLEREKDGERLYTVYKPSKKTFEISVLLDGIPTPKEVEVLTKMDKILENQERMYKEFISKLDTHYNYLITLPENINRREDIEAVIKELNAKQTIEITSEIMTCIETSFGIFDDVMDDKLKEIYNDLKSTDDVRVKLKLSIPLIHLLGINFETEFNIKTWAKSMYQKYQCKLFELMG